MYCMFINHLKFKLNNYVCELSIIYHRIAYTVTFFIIFLIREISSAHFKKKNRVNEYIMCVSSDIVQL